MMHTVHLSLMQYRMWLEAFSHYWTMPSGDATPLLMALSELEAMR